MVSIIIPYYNRPEKLRRCLDSILNQTYQDFEALVIDDHSMPPLILDLDGRIRVFRNTKNLGPGLSRNVGLDNAKGEFIAFLDSDDYWHPDFLKKCLKRYETATNKPTMVFTNTLSVTKNGEVPKRNWHAITESILPNILINKRPWATSSCLWKAHIIKDVRWTNNRNWEDYVFDITVALKSNRVSEIDEFLVFYDNEGEDKLSNSDYFTRSLEKTYSILNIHKVLKDSVHIKNKDLRHALITELITSLEIIKGHNYNEQSIKQDILKSLKDLQNFFIFNIINFINNNFSNDLAIRIINRIKKLLY